ncbi:MAG: sensor histidine kinase KdpD [Planctomycetota bacterium]|nr:sensor histidine kinase KdpD [Planctomycetota bacterium]
MSQGTDAARPDPDALLAAVTADEKRAARGKLRIFFGAAAGVGKTYAMLSAARDKAGEGVDLVVGYAEPHARPETEALLLGLELMPYKLVEYRSTKFKEFDLDAALKRRPELILVDELAHTNAPGMRHAKRWQDIDELLQAGIDVYTTLNVQHIESLNDVVAQVTGVIVRETLPDAVFEAADEVELVDLAPDELLDRLSEGKVYFPEQAEQARQKFFRKSNLTALRELALRKTAERVGAQVTAARRQEFSRRAWPTSERLLVCISPSPHAARVIRSAKRMASALQAPWTVVYVETPRMHEQPRPVHDQLLRNFRLAERLGARSVTLTGLNPTDEILAYARVNNVTKIVVGKTARAWWREILRRPIVDQLIRRAADVDIYVIHGLPEARRTEIPEPSGGGSRGDDGANEILPRIDWPVYRNCGLILLACTAAAALLYYGMDVPSKGDLSNLIMVYLVGVVAVAARYGRTPSVVMAVVTVAFFDFFFVPPRFNFAVTDTPYLITFLVMLGVGLVIGTLTVQVREHAEASRKRERRIEALYRMTDRLAGAMDLMSLLDVAARELAEVFAARVVLLLPDERRRLEFRRASETGVVLPDAELAVAQWAFDHETIAGCGTDTLPSSPWLYLPIGTGSPPAGVAGVASVEPGQTPQLMSPEQRTLLEAFLDQIALAVERNGLAQRARIAQMQAEAERVRNTLLSSVSHDLRTPLAVISGASGGLLEAAASDPAASRELAQTIHDEAERLNRLVGNLLDLARLESGAAQPARQWQPLEEIVGSALHRLSPRLGGREVVTRIPTDLPSLFVDGVLFEQALIHLLDNAANYTPAGSPIEVAATAKPGGVQVSVLDRGPGLPPAELSRVFDKFFRGSTAGSQRGAGLGLAICKVIVEAHDGRAWAENRPPAGGTGAAFHLFIPVEGAPPAAGAIGTSAPNEGQTGR